MRFALHSLLAFGLCAASVQSALVDDYISKESPIVKAGILANIGTQGAKPGLVIASPSVSDPNYLYTWVRDSSLVFKALIDQFTSGKDSTLRALIDDFVSAEASLQQVSNPSGTVSTGGLGEPKFNIQGTAFTDSWGRPQRDGPALRSISMIAYSNWLIANGNKTYVQNTIWPTIKLDLDYVSAFWNSSGFDLWEEVSGSSYFTTVSQHRSLLEGAKLASALGQSSSATGYNTQAQNALCFAQTYWNPTGGYMTANLGSRSGIDANTVLASIHGFDASAGCDSVSFQPCSDKALSNLKVYVDSFRSVYPINAKIPANAAVATGRYKEDVYYNGNPWYLTTIGVAEQLYDSIIVWKAQRSITITPLSLAFFQQFSPKVTAGTYPSSSATYTFLLASIRTFADGFVKIHAKYTPSNGALAEQFTKENGTPISARDLTWSYAAALTAFEARAGTVPPSWGAKGLVVPSVCLSNAGPTVSLTFNVQATTVVGENIYLTGSIDVLRDWSADNALSLSADNYPTWTVTVTVPANTNFEYKYIRKNNGAVTWESDPNHSISTVATGTQSVNDTWR